MRTFLVESEEGVACALYEARIDEKLALARQQAKDGLGTVADAALFEAMRERIRRKFMCK